MSGCVSDSVDVLEGRRRLEWDGLSLTRNIVRGLGGGVIQQTKRLGQYSIWSMPGSETMDKETTRRYEGSTEQGRTWRTLKLSAV